MPLIGYVTFWSMICFYRLCLNRMRVLEIRANVYVNPVFGWVFDFRCCVYCVYTDNDNKFILNLKS